MGFFSRFERRVEDGFEKVNDKLFDSPISPVQIAKKAEKEMRREKMVGAGKELAPTLFTILVNPDDDNRLFGYYPTLAGETETYLKAKAQEEGLVMDGSPLVRFIVDDELKNGHFEVIAELVSAPIVAQLRKEEMKRYGLDHQSNNSQNSYHRPNQNQMPQNNSRQRSKQHQNPNQPRSNNGQNRQNKASGIDVMADSYEDFDPNHDYASDVNYNSNVGSFSDFSNFNNFEGFDDNKGFDDSKEFSDVPKTELFVEPLPGAPDVSPQTQSQSQPELINLTTNRPFVLARQQIIIGRGLSCDIVLDDLNASRTHAQLCEIAPNTWQISDMGSLNGTLVNGHHIAEAVLNQGDRISIGTTTFLFTSDNE